MGINKYLFKNTVLYGISTFATKLITFLMVPFYTYVLTKEQYGSIDVIFTSLNLLMPLLTLCIHQSIVRFALEKESNKKLIFTYSTLVAFAGIAVLLLVSPLLFKIKIFKDFRELFVLLIILNIVYTIISEFTRGLDKIKELVIGNILFIFISTGLNIYTISTLKLGVSGYIISSCIAYLIVILYYTFIIKIKKYFTKQIFYKNNFILLKDMLKFSVFLIPNAFFWWITNASDRYIILALIGPEQNGIYAVANKIPVIITSIGSVFIQAWTLTAVKNNNSKDKANYYTSVFRNICSVIFIMVSFVFVILKIFIRIYVSEDYFISWESSTFLVLAAAFNVLASFVGTNYVVAKRNLGNMLSTLLGAILNTILNFIFIPLIGLVGAALSTCISYVVVVIYRIFDTKKYTGANNYHEFSRKNILTWAILNIQIIVLFINDNIFDLYNLLLFLLILFLNRFIIKEGFLMVVRFKSTIRR